MQLVQSTSRAKQKDAVVSQNLATRLIEWFRRWRSLQEVGGKQMQLVETLPLGGKRQLMLVSCAGERFLIGGGMESVEAIVRLKAEVASDVVATSLDETCQ